MFTLHWRPGKKGKMAREKNKRAHCLKIMDNGINRSETTVSVGYTVLGGQYW